MKVWTIKEPDDPTGIVLVSVGGGPEIAGCFCVYRGSKEAALACLEAAAGALRAMAAEPEIAEGRFVGICRVEDT